MAHEPHCNCCGCSQLRIIDAGFVDSLNTSGPLVDYPTSSPTTVTSIDATWSGGLRGDFNEYGAFVGKAKLDLGASQITLSARYQPFLIRGTGYVYAHETPPTQNEITSTIVASLYDGVQATTTMALVQRDMPSELLDNLIIGLQEGDPWSSNGTVFSVPQQKAMGYAYSYYTGKVRTVVNAFTDLPEPASTMPMFDGSTLTMDATAGTPLSAFKSRPLTGIESKLTYSENLSFGGTPYGWFVYPDNASSVVVGGYDAKSTLSCGSQEVLVVPTPAATKAGFGCVAQPNGEDPPTQGFFTAWVDRGSRAEAAIQQPTHTTVTIYRNGEQVFSANNPTSQQLNAAYSQDGVYLTVTEVDDRSLPAWTNAYPDWRRHGARLFKDFSSRVVDTVKPVVGFKPPDDIYLNTFGQFAPARGILFSTKPVNSPLSFAVNMIDEDPTSVIARPVASSQPLQLSSGGSLNGTEGAGTYVLRPFGRTQCTDMAGNKPDSVPTASWKVHSLPSVNDSASFQLATGFNHLGGIPKLEDPGLQTREHWRPRLDTEPVSSLLLTFDRKVKADQVTASQLTLAKDGATVTGCTMEQVSETQWKVSIPTSDQTPKSFWVLTYDPGGQVLTDDIVIARYSKRSDFPAVGSLKTIYIHNDADGNDVRFYYGRAAGVQIGPLSYQQIGPTDPPLDYYGTPYAPEPCVLATRAAWLMADMNGYPRAIDTSSTTGPYQIGRVASVSASQGFDHEKKQSLVGGSGGIWFPHVLNYGEPGQALGTYSPLVNYKGYTPSVPSLTSPADDCSYFGLTTTIDPCHPANVSACASPKIAQKHASAIRCDGDIESIEVSLVAFDENGNPQDLSGVKFGNVTGGLGWGTPELPVDFYVNDGTVQGPSWSQLANAQGNRTAAFLMGLSGQPYTFTTTLDGKTLPQNVWACVDGERQAALPVQKAVTRKPDVICTGETNPGEWYSVRYTFDSKTYSESDVLGWTPIKVTVPAIRRADGTLMNGLNGQGGFIQNEIELLPGDTYDGTGNFWAPSLVGGRVPWEQYRVGPEQWPDDWRPMRGYASGIIRTLQEGNLTQSGVQGCLSVYRAHKTFPALKTTTLGELCISLSFRVAMKATLNYKDYQLAPNKFTRDGDTPCVALYNYRDPEMVAPRYGYVYMGSETGGTLFSSGSYGRYPTNSGLDGWQKLSDAQVAAEKTVTHQFLGELSDTLVLSKEKEESLANGDAVYVAIGFANDMQGNPGPGIWYWKLKKA